MEVKARAAEAAAGAEGQQETPAATVVTAVLNSTHIVPPPTCGPDTASLPAVLLIIVPGAFIQPEAYANLAKGVQASFGPTLNVWTAVMAYNAQHMMELTKCGAALESVHTEIYNGVITKASLCNAKPFQEERGGAVFRAQRGMGGSGRCVNAVLMAHSYAGDIFASVAFKNAGAFILLGSSFNNTYCTKREFVNWEDWSRPVLMLGGELDGQMLWTHSVQYAAQAAGAVSKLGLRHAVTHKPVVLLRDANHVQIVGSELEVRMARGDISTDTPIPDICKDAASVIGAFIGVSFSHTVVSRDASFAVLKSWAYRTAASDATHHSGGGVSNSIQPFMQALRVGGGKLSDAVYAGICDAAEEAALQAQMLIAQPLGADAASRLKVAVSVHAYVDGSPPGFSPACPYYWMKLKSCNSLASALGILPATADPSAPRGPMIDDYVEAQGRDLNAAVLQTALQRLPASVIDRYKERGSPLVLGPDLTMATIQPPISGPAEFIRNSRLSFKRLHPAHPPVKEDFTPSSPESKPSSTTTTTTTLAVMVQSPVLNVPLPARLAFLSEEETFENREALRFVGSTYAKIMSVGLAMEWVMLGSLREPVHADEKGVGGVGESLDAAFDAVKRVDDGERGKAAVWKAFRVKGWSG
ncbi:MAG: hypothetical protein WDW38_007504 [Sanguina aurantia]